MAVPKPEFWNTEPGNRDQYYIAGRMILSMKSCDRIVLPCGSLELERFVEFCIKVFGYKSDQFIWVPKDPYLLEDAVLTNWGRLAPYLEDCREGVIVPYAANQKHWDIASMLGMAVMGEEPDFAEMYGNKCTLHLHIKANGGDKTGGRPYFDGIQGLRIPRGYVVDDWDQLRFAISVLNRDGVSRMVIKAPLGAGGDGIYLNITHGGILPASLTFPVVLEEMIEIIHAPSVQYTGGVWNGTILLQVMDGNSFAGNHLWSPPEKVVGQINTMTRLLIDHLKPQGCGGFDFLVDTSGLVYFVDPNPRMTGAHPALWARERLLPCAQKTPFLTWKVKAQVDVFEFWKRLQEAGIAFNAQIGQGVVPLCYMPGVWSMLMAFGPTDAVLNSLQHDANTMV